MWINNTIIEHFFFNPNIVRLFDIFFIQNPSFIMESYALLFTMQCRKWKVSQLRRIISGELPTKPNTFS